MPFISVLKCCNREKRPGQLGTGKCVVQLSLEGRESVFLWQLPHLTAVQSALLRIRENSAFQQIPAICLMTTSLQSAHLECLTSSAIPRAASVGQLEDPWEENLYFATWLLFPNLVEILEDNIQLIILSWFFFLHLVAFGVYITNSHRSWRGDKWHQEASSPQKISRG